MREYYDKRIFKLPPNILSENTVIQCMQYSNKDASFRIWFTKKAVGEITNLQMVDSHFTINGETFFMERVVGFRKNQAAFVILSKKRPEAIRII